MAVAVIGGLITPMLVSLIVIPAAFTVVDDVGERMENVSGTTFGSSVAPDAFLALC